MSGKEKVVAELIASGSSTGPSTDGKKKVLIEEVGGSQDQVAETQEVPKVVPVEDDGPSLMEMMIQAQQEAKRKDDDVKAKVRAAEEKKGLGGGFKKGFLGGGANKSKPKKATKKEQKEGEIPTITAKQGAGKGKSGVVLDDVQKAMKEEEERNPLLQNLKNGDWADENLMGQLQSNPVLMRGLQNPKCQAALQLLQTDPKAAKKKYEHDPEVAAFLQAFSGLMADHFTRLGEAQQQTQSHSQQQTVPIPEGQTEIGPLHADAIARQKERNKGDAGIISEVNKEEEARVQEIVQDEELRNMLMDPQLQRVLQECGDPVKFQKHMRDPVTAYKIKKLYDAGLVGTAK